MLIQGKRAAGRGEGPGFFDLIERLFSDLGTLLDQKLMLLTIELKNEGAVVVRDLLMVLVGAVVVALGLLLISIEAAVWIGAAIASVPGGYGIVGGVFLLAPVRPSAPADERFPPGSSVLRGSWTRAGSRLSDLVNRVIDEVGDTIEKAAIPPLIGRIRGFLPAGSTASDPSCGGSDARA